MSLIIKQHRCLPTSIDGPLANSIGAWNRMRTEHSDTAFSIPAGGEEWVAKAERNSEVPARAAAIIALARRLQIRAITSHGVGGGWLEFHIKRGAPDIHLTVTDFAEAGLTRLRAVFPECDSIQRFDLLRERWPPYLGSGLHVLHRVETEFSKAQWREVFAGFKSSQIKRIIFVPSEFLTIKAAYLMKKEYVKDKLRRRRPCFCGWLYSKNSFNLLWDGYYTLESEEPIGDLTGFNLTIN